MLNEQKSSWQEELSMGFGSTRDKRASFRLKATSKLSLNLE